MADNVLLNSGTGGDTVRTVDKAGIETQVVLLDVGGTGTEALVGSTNAMPVSVKNPTTASAPATYAVTSSSGQAVASNASRKAMVITNVGSVAVYFGIGATAVVSSGIVLFANGTWVMDPYTFSTGAINAICASSSTLAIQEFT